ncbi:MAG TPA: alpha/beta fold hydrolase [Solirubrobacteraceae bacterium]|nr:alpha/beta fold hydrolase [Solirubrobacteraceae bacterium]
MTEVTRRFVQTSAGTIHCAIAGDHRGTDVVLLHQTPRSWNEYRDVLPLLGRRRRTIAIDTVGFGDSSALPWGSDSIERWAEVALEVLDELKIERAHLVGHHTGAAVATEMATTASDRARSIVLSSAPFDDAETRAAHLEGPAVADDVSPQPDGSHVLELWRTRAGFDPEGRIDLLQAYLIDALKAGPRAAEGHQVVARYDMQAAVTRLRCPVLLVGATDDPYAYPALEPMRAALPEAQVEVIQGGMVPLPDQLPEQFAAVVERFLDQID